MAKAKLPAVSSQAALVDKYVAIQGKSKALFRQQCDLKAQLIALFAGRADGRLPLGDGRTLVRSDNFAGKLTHYKQVGIDRFEIAVEGEILPTPEETRGEVLRELTATRASSTLIFLSPIFLSDHE